MALKSPRSAAPQDLQLASDGRTHRERWRQRAAVILDFSIEDAGGPADLAEEMFRGSPVALRPRLSPALL